MKPVFWLFILFVLASGLSAWIGNEWGRLIGKRKLTVFSLRPKHTSSLLTILLSIALSLGFLGVYLLVDPNSREALLSPESSQERQSQIIQEQASDFNSTLQRIQHRSNLSRLVLNKVGQPKPKIPNHSPENVQTSQVAQRPASINMFTNQHTIPAPTAIAFQVASLKPLALNPDLPKKHSEIRVKQTRVYSTNKSNMTALSPPRPRNAQHPHLSVPDSARSSISDLNQTPLKTALLKSPIFQLRVYGGRSPAESRQIVSGVLELTRAYARDLGLTTEADPLQVQAVNLAESHLALEKDQVFQMQVKVGLVSHSSNLLPVRLVLKPESKVANFDPQQLLEQSRLNPDNNQSLHSDLSQAILALAHETRQDFQLEDIDNTVESSMLATTPLSIQIMQLHRSGNTLQGQIVLLADASNLTEN